MTLHPHLNRYLEFKTIDSTNLEAQRRRHEFAGENVLLVSDEQTAGKGQHGRQWESSAGLGVWATLFIGQPDYLRQDLQLLSLYTGLIVKQTIQALTGIDTRLKWPNDIMINSQKCGGILTELQWKGNSTSSAIIGMGINLSHQKNDFPEDIQGTSTSLLMEGWKEPDRDQFMNRLIYEFFEQFELLIHPEHLIGLWNDAAWKYNEIVHWQSNDKDFEGLVMGVTKKGEAQILRGDKTYKFHSGEIRWGRSS